MTPSQELRPLFTYYPGLRESLPHMPIGALPTPVERLHQLEQAIDTMGAQLFVKRDDMSGMPYGGNKVRKLEFLLAHALRKGCKEVLTFGGVGSNHALATALYAKQQGLACISMLVPQPNAYSVRTNLLMAMRAGAEMHHCPNMPMTALATLEQLWVHRRSTGRFPYLIPPGGSSPRGVLGFVNAAFELKEQVDSGQMPEPDCIYVASGTMGTAVGLLLGLKAAGLASRIVAVRVTAPMFSSIKKAARLFHAANRMLHNCDHAFPLMPFPYPDFRFNHDFYGQEYGLYTPEAMRAVRMLQDNAGPRLEGTYTGKTFAALLDDIKSGVLRDKTVLFWNTYNAYDLQAEVEDMDYRDLPTPFHRYFETDVQPLDQYSPADGE